MQIPMQRQTKAPLPPTNAPPKKVAQLFCARRKELAEQANRLPSELADELERISSNSKEMRMKLKGLEVKVPNSQEVSDLFGSESLLSDDALESLVLKSSTQWSRANKAAGSSSKEREACLKEIAQLLAAHDVFFANRVKAGIQAPLERECEYINSFPTKVKTPSLWAKMKGAVLFTAAFTVAFFSFMSATGASSGVRGIASAICFGLAAIVSTVSAASKFSYEKADLHFNLRRASRKIEELYEMRDNLAQIIGAMNVAQEDLLAAINKFAQAPETSELPAEETDSEA
jgi:hypothetical protein